VRTPRVFQSLGGQSLLPRLLLANGPAAGEALQWLPALLQASEHSSGGSQDHSAHLAICCLGLDMVGPHLLVAVDKFIKWIEAKLIKKLDGSSTIKFFNEIITRYGVPRTTSSLTT
jgi:hypothetical protein